MPSYDFGNSSKAQFVPPPAAAAAGKRALEMKKRGHKRGTPVGWKRASQFANRTAMSLTTVRRVKAYFDRHEVDKKGKDWNNKQKPSKGKLAWWGWGGDAGYSWAKGIVRKADAHKEKASAAETAAHEPKDTKLWEECKKKAIKRFGKWGRYASFYAVNLYKKAGGAYNEPKEQASLRERIMNALLPHREVAAAGMYAECKVKNNVEIHRWIKTICGVPIDKDELHCTVMYSTGNVDMSKVKPGKAFTLPPNRGRKLMRLGESTALVFTESESKYLASMWQMFRDAGATWDFPTFVPHMSISYKWEVQQHELDKMNAYEGPVVFGAWVASPLDQS